MTNKFYKVKLVQVSTSTTETTPLLHPFQFKGLFSDNAHALIVGDLPDFLCDPNSYASGVAEVEELTREQARAWSLQVYPEHYEEIEDPKTHEKHTEHIASRDLTEGF